LRFSAETNFWSKKKLFEEGAYATATSLRQVWGMKPAAILPSRIGPAQESPLDALRMQAAQGRITPCFKASIPASLTIFSPQGHLLEAQQGLKRMNV